MEVHLRRRRRAAVGDQTRSARTTQATYDYFGDAATTTGPCRTHTTSYAYDYLGDPTQADHPGRGGHHHTYDHLGELTSTANAYGDTTSYAYDYQGDLSDVTNPDGSRQDVRLRPGRAA